MLVACPRGGVLPEPHRALDTAGQRGGKPLPENTGEALERRVLRLELRQVVQDRTAVALADGDERVLDVHQVDEEPVGVERR